MKKFSLFILAILFAVACSSDNQETSTINESAASDYSTARDGVNLEDLYADMIKSQSYVNFKSAAEDFSRKMNFDGNISDINSNQKIIIWISNNLNKTKFSSVNEAGRELQNVNNLSLLAVQNNFSFYEALEGETSVRLQEVMGPIEPPVTTEGCPTCEKAFNLAVKSLTAQFTAEVITAVATIGTGGGAAAGVRIANAKVAYLTTMTSVTEDFIKCCIG